MKPTSEIIAHGNVYTIQEKKKKNFSRFLFLWKITIFDYGRCFPKVAYRVVVATISTINVHSYRYFYFNDLLSLSLSFSISEVAMNN
jgi:hypothetical protein